VSLYQDADIVSFPSTYEGFGMPILEAQAVGRVVVTSRVLSMPEVAGEGACFVDPFDPSSIRRGLEQVIGDGDYRQKLIQKGFKNVERFDAERIANQYREVYVKVAQGLASRGGSYEERA
jgi:glycosyltransferase involved in cell wall biosynthesis